MLPSCEAASFDGTIQSEWNREDVAVACAFLPVMMSLGALATVLIFLAVHGTAPQADEGTKNVPESPRQALPILALQIIAALAAAAPVFLLHW